MQRDYGVLAAQKLGEGARTDSKQDVLRWIGPPDRLAVVSQAAISTANKMNSSIGV